MIRFNIKNSKLIIDAQTLTVTAFNDIYESDKTKDKNKATCLLKYVFHLCDISQENSFRDVAESQREALCKRNSFGKADYQFSNRESQLLSPAIEWYNILNKNSVQRLAMAMDKKIDQISNFLETNEIKTADDFDAQMDAVQKIEKVLKSKRTTDDYVRSEMEKTKNRGQVSSSPLEKGLVGYNPNATKKKTTRNRDQVSK
jgi:hypothetical protein